CPYGQLPILEADGEVLSQSGTIGRYLARKYNLIGKGDIEAARCDEIIDAVTDFRQLFTPVFYEKDEEKKPALLAEAIKKGKERFLPKFNQIIQDNDGKHLVCHGEATHKIEFKMNFSQRNLKFLVLTIMLGVNFLALNVYTESSSTTLEREFELESQMKTNEGDTDSLEEQHSLKTIETLLARVFSNTEQLREQLRQHTENTQNSLKQISQDVHFLKSQSPSGGTPLLTSINPRLSHRNRLKQCLRAISTNTDYNNSLTISFPESEKEEMEKLLTLYNLRACILEHSLEWWLRQILDKAGISGIPKATLYEQWKLKPKYFDLGEEFNTAGDPNPACLNLEKLQKKSSLLLLFPGSCVRLYSNSNCLGENRIFASDRNNSLVLNNDVDGFDKRTESIGKCFP
ncbi:unnamed protein product, partial [Allacma fusca]